MTGTARRGMGQLEQEVMAILWEADDWLTPGEVHARLRSDPPVVYATVMTILRRLWKKESLERRQQGKAYGYHPVKGQEEQAAERMTAILAAASDPDAALTHFLAGLDPRRRKHLRALLDGRR